MTTMRADLKELAELMTKRLEFNQFERETGEVFWQLTLPHTNFAIQVRSGMTRDGIQLTSSEGPELGLRVFLINLETQAAVFPSLRIRRNRNVLNNLRSKVGVVWKQAVELA